jgi:hypothetical protein
MATAAAAIVARLRREVDQLFFDNDAFGPERAVEFEPRRGVQQRYLEQLIAEGVVHEAQPGHYWLDLPAFNEQRRQRWLWSMRVIAVGAVVFVVVFVIRYFLKG